MSSIKSHTRIRQSKGDVLFDVLIHSILFIGFILVLYPLIYIISSSFSSPQEVVSGNVWLYPVKPTLMAYEAIFNNDKVWIGYLNSIIYALVGTGINVVMTVMASYPLSRKDFHGRNFFMGMFVFTMLFNAGLIPTYLVVKDLNLIDKRLVMWIPNALMVWYVIIARTFFQTTIPRELNEAADIDGCGDIQFILRIAIPLSGPIIAVLGLFYAVYHWNSYFHALIYLKSSHLFPLQIILRNILINSQIDPDMMVNIEEMLRQQGMKDLLKYALIVVASIPILAFYPFVQKFFVKGIMVGAIKG